MSGRLSRRETFRLGLGLTGAVGGWLAEVRRATAAPIKLPSLVAPTEPEANETPSPLPPDKRVGFAVVGLGHLALNQILPAFAESKMCRPTALVSGDAAKAATIAGQYGIDTKHLYDYKTFDRLRDDPAVDAVYIVLPNGLHAEYSIRAANAGKHVLCEKPMAISVDECQRMIAASQKVGRHLMIAYRLQYEPYNMEAIRVARAGELGKLRSLSATNGQSQGDPKQWRLRRALAGGGSLPDVGIYCVNAARYLSGEEPNLISGMVTSTPNDPRFKEVEEQADFVLRFPSGFVATGTSSYGFHDSKRFRLIGTTGWLDLDPAFPYRGQSLRVARKPTHASAEIIEKRELPAKNHFAAEMDHLAMCIRENKKPRTPGEEGLQDQRIIEAIYQSARAGRNVELPPAGAKVESRAHAAG